MQKYKFRVEYDIKKDKVTICRIFWDKMLLAKSTASCSPMDKFDWKVGRKYALLRAYKKLDEKVQPLFMEWAKQG